MKDLLFCKQNHSNNVVLVGEDVIVSGFTQPFENTDGMITKRTDIALVSYGADCTVVAFWDHEKIGICHAGWRGFVNGIHEKMLEHFDSNVSIYVGPFLHSFEILKDDCYDKIYKKFGDKYFIENHNEIIFNFKEAVLDHLPQDSLIIDDRSTTEHPELASWRRDKKSGNGTQNRLVVWRGRDNHVNRRLFYPGEKIIIEDI